MAAIAYYPGLQGEFVFDDIGLVQSDSFYTDSDTDLSECWQRPYWRKGMSIGQYRPLTVASFLMNTRLFGMSSPAFRIINLLLHTLIALLVFKLAMVLRLGKLSAFFASLLYAVHPLLSEAVIPTSGRAELLCLIFILAGLIFYIKFGFPRLFSVKQDDAVMLDANATFSGMTVRIFIPGICLILACWSKENGVILLPLCLLYDLLYRQLLKFPKGYKWFINTAKRFLIPYTAFLVALLMIVFYRIAGVGVLFPIVSKESSWIDNPIIGESCGVRILTALKVQGMVLAKFFWPRTLSHDYSYAQILPVESFINSYVLFALGMLILFPIILCFVLPKRKKIICFISLAYIISILPAGNFIIPTGTIFGERTYYAPLIWLCFLFVFTLVRIARKSRPVLVVCLIILTLASLAFVKRIRTRAQDWQSQMAMAIKGVETAPESVKTWSNLAIEFAHQEDFDKAVAACDLALEKYPEHRQTLTNRAYYYIALDKYSKAEQDFRELINLGSRNPDIFNKLGAILATQGNKSEAKIMWKHSLTINPYQPEIKKAMKKLQGEISSEIKK